MRKSNKENTLAMLAAMTKTLQTQPNGNICITLEINAAYRDRALFLFSEPNLSVAVARLQPHLFTLPAEKAHAKNDA
jgi:hypothetical protein